MSYLFPRNVGGFTTIESLLVNDLQIQTQSTGGFKIYTNDPTTPLFTVDGTTGTITTKGTLKVEGFAEFKTVSLSETTQSLFKMADGNDISDTFDIGVYGEYNRGFGIRYSGIYRRASDPYRRWFLVKDFEITAPPPVMNFPPLTSGYFAGMVCDNVSSNDGTATNPSYTFFSDMDTGMYLDTSIVGHNCLAFTAGESAIMKLRNTGTALEVQFNSEATIYSGKLGTQNDVASSVGGGITTGSLTLQSAGLADKWFRFMTTNPAGAYAGSVYSFGTSSHYFTTNSAADYQISYTTQSVTSTNPPDFRHVSKVNLFSLNNTGLTTTVRQFNVAGSQIAPAYAFSGDQKTGMYLVGGSQIGLSLNGSLTLDLTTSRLNNVGVYYSAAGTNTGPAYSFATDSNTGMYLANADTIGLACNGVKQVDISTTLTTFTNQIAVNAGSVANPSLQFLSGGSQTGVYFANPGIGFSAANTSCAVVTSDSFTMYKPVRAANGDGTAPAYSFTNLNGGGLWLNSGNVRIQQTNAIYIDIGSTIAVTGALLRADNNCASAAGSTTNCSYQHKDNAQTGMYFPSTTSIGFSTSNTNRLSISTTLITATLPVQLPAGTSAAPSLQFTANTGIYYSAIPDTIGVTIGGSNKIITSSVVQIGSSSGDTTTKLYVPDGSANLPSITFIGETTSGLYRIGNLNIGISISTVPVLDINQSRMYSINPVYLPNGSTSNPAVTFNSDATTGMYLTAGTGELSFSHLAKEGLRIKVSATTSSSIIIGNITNASTYQYENNLRFAGLIGKQSAQFDYTTIAERFWTGTTKSELLLFKNINVDDRIRHRAYTHIFQTPTAAETYASVADNNTALTISLGSTYIGDTTSGSTAKLIIPYGSAAAPSVAFNTETTTGIFRSGTNSIGLTCGGTKILDIGPTLVIATNPIQIPRGTTNGFGLQFQTSTTTGLLYDTALLVDNITFKAGNNTVTTFTPTAASFSLPIMENVGSAAAPSYSFTSSPNTGKTGLYYIADHILAISNNQVNTWQFSAQGTSHKSYNPLTIFADGTNAAVEITTTKIKATATQTLLNNAAILEYNFTGANLYSDNSINKYAGNLYGTVSQVTPSIDSSGYSPLNSKAANFASNAGNGLYTITPLAEMKTATTLRVVMQLYMPTLTSGNCWAIYGNNSSFTTNYIRMYITSASPNNVLNIICVSGGGTSILANYTLPANYVTSTGIIWNQIEFTTTATGNALYINGTLVTLSYITGNASTQFIFNTQINDKTNIAAYVGGGYNAYNSPVCEIAYFAIIQTGATDTSVPYREQVHELVTNKLTVSTTDNINNGYYAISTRSGELVWDNSIVASKYAVTLAASKDLIPYSLKMAGQIKYNYQRLSDAKVDLTANSTGHYFTLTNNNVDIYLPTGASQAGREFIFTWKGTPGQFRIYTSGSDTIGGDASPLTYTAKTNTTFRLIFDSNPTATSDWIIL